MVETGQPWLVAIEGDPGVGKTALARRCLAEAEGVSLRVLPARADQTEADLDFGLVDQLLRAAGEVSHLVMPAGGTGSAISSFAVGARLLEVVGDRLATGSVAIFIDDLQWADRKSVEALTFMLRRLSVDPVITVVTYRGPGDRLDEAAQRMLQGVEHRLHIPLEGLRLDEVASLAAALGTESLDDEVVRRLHQDTGGHPLYLRTLLSEGSGFDPSAPGRAVLPRSLAAAIGGHLRGLPSETRVILEMLAVLSLRMPLAQLGQAAQVGSPSAAIEPAVAAGLVDWWPEEPTCPVAIRHPLVRDAIYAGIPAARRRLLHARAASVVSEAVSWKHRVAALDRPDEDLAAELEQLGAEEAATGHPALAATHLQWASDISPARADRERRLLTAALHLTLAEESPGEALREAVEGAAPSPLRGCVLGTMAYSSGQLREAERRFSQALAQAQEDPDSQPMAALIANHLAGTYTLMGDGARAIAFGRQALEGGLLDAAVASQTRTLIAMGASLVSGPHAGLAELAHLEADPAQVRAIDVDGLSYRGMLWLLAGDPGRAISDLVGSLGLARRGATLTLGVRAYFWLALAQYVAGAWDDVLLTAEQGFSAAAIHSRRFELPLLHLAAGCVPAGRGAAAGGRAARAAGRRGRGQRGLQPGTGVRRHGPGSGLPGSRRLPGHGRRARSLAGRGGPGRPQPADRGLVAAVAGRGPGRLGPARPGRRRPGPAAGRQRPGRLPGPGPGLAGGLAGRAAGCRRPGPGDLPAHGEQAPGAHSPVYTARLLLAHGRLLRRTGQRRLAVERLRRANHLYLGLRAAPFLARTEQELAACHLPATPAANQSVLTLTSRETEVAHLVGKGLSNPEIAAELFISRKAVEYHLGNIYAKCGLQGRQQLRRFVEQWAQPTTV